MLEDTVQDSTTISSDIKEFIYSSFDAQTNNNFVFCYISRGEKESSRELHFTICTKDVSNEFYNYFEEWHKHFCSQFAYIPHQTSTFSFVTLSVLKERLQYISHKEPRNIVCNQKEYQGVVFAERITQFEVLFIGNKMKFEKLQKNAQKIVNEWKNILDDQLKSLPFPLKNGLHFKPFQQDIEQKAKLLSYIISERKEEIIDILTECVTYDAVLDEIKGSLETLENIHLQTDYLRYISGKIKNASVFLPVNFPLYSYVLYAVVIAFAAENVYVRCPIAVRPLLERILDILGVNDIFPNISILHLDRKEFNEKYVNRSDLIIFTGRYENAKKLLNKHADKMFIFNGAGINPFLIASDADIDFAVEKTVEMRTFNSGQDCAGPDAILVHESLYEDFKAKIIQKLSQIQIGSFKNQNTRVGKLLTDKNLFANIELVRERKVLYGGLLNFVDIIIYPTVIESKITDYNYHEYFAPIFNLVPYSNTDDLEKYFTHKSYMASSMYVTMFGNESYIENHFPPEVILRNEIILEADHGYNQFGGYGKKANFFYYKGKKYYFPILIPRDITRFLQEEEKNMYTF